MADREAINNFITRKRFAIVGASNDRAKYGNKVYRDLRAKGYTVFPVNPKLELVEGDPCYPSLKDLNTPVDGVVSIVPPAVTEKIVQEAHDAGIKLIWMQPGAESQKAIELCRELGMTCVHDDCIMVRT